MLLVRNSLLNCKTHLGNWRFDQIDQHLCQVNTYTVTSPPPLPIHPTAKQTKGNKLRNWRISSLGHVGMVPYFIIYGSRLMWSKLSYDRFFCRIYNPEELGLLKIMKRELYRAQNACQWDLLWDYDSWNIYLVLHTGTPTSETIPLPPR